MNIFKKYVKLLMSTKFYLLVICLVSLFLISIPISYSKTLNKKRFVIISHIDLIDTGTYDEYISYRISQGYNHLETIDASKIDYDTSDKIIDRLIELYRNDEPGFEYLVIIGDEGKVPIPYLENGKYRISLQVYTYFF